MLASNPSVNGFPDRMNGLDFFFSPSATVDASTGNRAEDDDWGEFVDSSDAIDSLSPNPNGADSAPNRIGSEKKSQAPWVASRGPVPLSVFGEEEEDAEGDESGASVPSFGFSFDSFSRKHNDGNGSVNGVVNTNPTVGITGLIANLYRENGQNELTNGRNLPENNRGHLEMNGNNSNRIISRGFDVDLSSSANVHVNSHLGLNDKESLSSRKIENSAVSLDTLNWNPLNFDTKRSERASNVVNSNSNHSDLGFADQDDDDDDDDDGWEFKDAESMFQTADGGFKEKQDNANSGSAVVQNSTNLTSSAWNSPANGTGPDFDTGKLDAVKSGFGRENGDDDPWANGGWDFKVAEAGEPKNDLANKESNGWGFGFGFEPVSKIENTSSFQSNFEKEPEKRETGSISFPSNANVNSEGTSWAFNQPSLETGKNKEEKEVQTDKPKGALPLSFFEDEEVGTSDSSLHEDNPVSVYDFSTREKTKSPSQTVSINDLISSLYSQVEEKNAVNLSENSEGYGFVNVTAASDSNLVNGEDDSWEFQGPSKTITDSSIAEGADEFDSTWEFQGPSPALKNSDAAEGVDEFDDDSWEFQGPTQPVKDSTSRKGDNGSWESERNSVENKVGNSFDELHEKSVISIERHDYQGVFHKLKTELYYIAQNHLENLKDTRSLHADYIDDDGTFQKYDDEIEDLQNWLNNDVLICEVNLESIQPRQPGITELSKALQEPKFQALDSEDLLSERLLSAKKDWKSTIELLKHATLTLKILNLGSPEQQSKYASTWFIIASACAQELRRAASIWKQVIENDVQEEILSKPQGKSYALSVGEIYRVVKILRASTRLYRPWILLASKSSNVLPVLDECVNLWSSSGLEEALVNNFNRDDSADQLLESIKYIDEVDAFTMHTCITSATSSSPTCYISGLSTEIVPGIKMVEWNGEHYLLPIANLWANLINRDPPGLPGHRFPTVS